MSLEEGPSEIGGWRKEKVLGTGGFGTVSLWKHEESGRKVAVKKCRWGTESIMTPKQRERWENEVDIMLRLQHKNVVSCFPVPAPLASRPGDLPCLCMEYCTEGDLRKVLNKVENCCGLRESEVRSILKDVAAAIQYLHSKRIIHRDLKPENIVLQEEDSKISYKLIDLGYAKELDQSSVCTSFVGTLQYLAPELFLTRKYSCTVDYWSLGLVTHEVITGVRPFLPSLPPAQWMQHVQKKSREDVCAYVSTDGEIVFRNQIFSENRISALFREHMERWLRIMLEWEPKTRGRRCVDGDIVAYDALQEILEKKMITLFVVTTCEKLVYEVDENVTVKSVQEWIERDTGVTMKEQEILLPRGNTPDNHKSALQFWAPPEEEEWMVYVFSCESPSPTIRLPEQVKWMMERPEVGIPYQQQRRVWAVAVHFLQQEAYIYKQLLQASKVHMLSLWSHNTMVHKSAAKMVMDMTRLMAKHELFQQSLQNDLDKYLVQSQRGGVTSQKMYIYWQRTREKCYQKVQELHGKVQEHETSSGAVNTKSVELQKSPYAKAKPPDALEALYGESMDLLQELKKVPKDERSQPRGNKDMVKLVYHCLKQREKLYKDYYLHLKKVWLCKREIVSLHQPLKEALQEIEKLSNEIMNYQLHRQDNIWMLLDTAIQHQKPKNENDSASGIQSSPLSLRDSQISFLSNSTDSMNNRIPLADIVKKSSQESVTLIRENQELRCRFQTWWQLSLQEQSKMAFEDETLDWSFLDLTPPPL